MRFGNESTEHAKKVISEAIVKCHESSQSHEKEKWKREKQLKINN